MEEIKTPEGGTVIKIPIEAEVKQAYIDYSMSVIVQRALPDVRDGLKPVHRRIMYAMDSLHLSSGGKTKKCATIVGEVLGHYHPHGDASVYDALVRLGQDFAQRYTTVTPQGNFGTIAGDPAAAYRYTEAKMSKITEEMVADISKNTVDMIPNFDDTTKEPSVLPAAFPFLLCNGTTGIAVGMATNMPTHNLREVAAAISAYIDNPEISIDELMNYIKGPDFPTGGVIYGREGIKKAYKTGRGKITIRSKFTIETDKNGRESIVFTEVPYGINTTNIIRRIKELVRDKQIEGIVGANDESSDRSGMRLVVDLKRGAITKVVLNQLFAKTDLQSNFGVINLALVPQEKEKGIRYDEPGYLTLKAEYLKPEVLNLKQLIMHFVNHRDEVITRRTIYDLKVAKHRMHILEALITAINNIDEVIKIIKESRDTNEAKARLEQRFNFDDEQAQAIVDMQLKRLTHLQIEDLQNEIKELQALIDYLQGLLADHNKILQLIKQDTNNLAEKYGDDRRTDIVAGEVESINVEDMIKEEDMVILISKLGYIKRVPVSQYKSQGRGGKGTISAKLVEEDYINQMFVASTHEHLIFITNLGKAYWVKVHEIPEASKTSRGSHIKSLLAVSANEEITIVERIREFSETEYLFMATANGIVKKTPTNEFRNAKAKGMQAIRLDDGDRLVSTVLSQGNFEIMLISRRGQALRITEEDVRPMGRSSRGVNGMKLANDDELCAATPVIPETDMLVITEKGFGKRVSFDEYSAHGRGTGGQKVFGNVDDKGEIVGALTVKENDGIMCITSQGTSLRVDANSISKQGRGSSGVRVVDISEPDYVVGIDRIAASDDESK
ncbi:DNA topoisomerase (ATP-hydrolyzing) subunit A [Treponema sp.]|uniref:DNA topoisomerase (ATP-hydrolyzing) subunit A n=1 Tax=Treponema sp. TaxID=166 RepID=UPI0025FFB20E|nr:DNA topoisomerase (ATP-hydrolyzing) subunit A [Treponema sp.]MCR5219247.1 DNA topoisomerase (ATP-hydrolyzing) subunit A [Treponema sp.]